MKNHLYFDLIPFWIIILMPVFLISGPFFADLGVIIVSILFLVNSKKNKLIKYYNNIYFKVFFIFCLILILSSLMSENTWKSLKNSFFYFRFGIFTLCFWYILDKNVLLIRYLFISILICFSSLIVDGYIQYIFGKNLFGFELYNEYRVSSFFGSELILGSYLARFFPILFGLFIFLDKSKKNKLLLFFLTLIFILSEGLIFLSGERLALFFMNLSAIYIILMIDEYKFYRLFTYIGSLFLITVLLISFPNSKDRLIDQTIRDLTKNTESESRPNIFSKPHNDMYVTGYKIFLDNKILGVGPRQYRNNCQKYEVSEYSCETHPHNTYIELLSEAGIFAFFIVLTLFLLICYLSIKHLALKIFKRNKGILSDFEVCLLSAVLISLWPFSPSGSFFNNWISIVYYFPVGILLWQRKKV
tara:strand:+ start:4174 stop:5421 length:1248 start_codon:yes stop_codon:yes gene_type:complete